MQIDYYSDGNYKPTGKLGISQKESSPRKIQPRVIQNSRHLKTSNKIVLNLMLMFWYRTLELHQAGLISYWTKQFEPNARPCFNENQNNKNDKGKKKPLIRLSLVNLTGAFALLAFGWLLSLFVFLVEKVISLWKANQVIVVWILCVFYNNLLIMQNSCIIV